MNDNSSTLMTIPVFNFEEYEMNIRDYFLILKEKSFGVKYRTLIFKEAIFFGSYSQNNFCQIILMDQNNTLFRKRIELYYEKIPEKVKFNLYQLVDSNERVCFEIIAESFLIEMKEKEK